MIYSIQWLSSGLFIDVDADERTASVDESAKLSFDGPVNSNVKSHLPCVYSEPLFSEDYFGNTGEKSGTQYLHDFALASFRHKDVTTTLGCHVVLTLLEQAIPTSQSCLILSMILINK